MQSTVEELDGNKVKLHVSVPADEFERAIDVAFKKLAREVRVPGFRPGKAPRRLLEARFGADAAREQALRDSLPEYYVEAVEANDVDVIAPPEIEITSGEEDGDVEFDAVVEVRPIVRLMGYDEITVEVPYEAIDDGAVDQQVDALRERFADLEDSEYPLIDEAYATIDITGSIDGEPVEGLTATDFLYRVGSGMVVAELDDQLRGTRPGAILEFSAELPERFGERAGDTVDFRVLVKDAKQKVLPELTDEWVDEASEFDTIDDLRADIRRRLDAMQKLQAQMTVRDKVLEAAADLVPVPAPEALVDSETRRRIEDLAHRLSHQKVSVEQYLEATGQEPEPFLEEVRSGAARGVLADLALRAVVAQEEIDATDDELNEEIDRLAERLDQKPERVRRDLEKRGVIGAVRSDVARGKALQFLVDHATVVDPEGNEIDLTFADAPDESSSEESDEADGQAVAAEAAGSNDDTNPTPEAPPEDTHESRDDERSEA
jgi:trigger factor